MIRKIYKILSVALVLVMILSCRICVMGTTLLNLEDTISESYLNLSSKLSLTWTPDNEISGSASGTYALSATDSNAYGTYKLYYADDEGVLSQYAPITEFVLNSGTTQAQYNGMTDQNVLPAEATKVVATLDGQIKAYADIPQNKQFKAGELLYSHAVFSDVHVFGDKTQEYNGYDDLPIALDTVMDMGADFLSVSGDLTYDDGLATIKEVLSGYEDYDIHVCTGNHDVGISETEWTSYWGNEMDYSFTHKGETFIYLSLQTASGYSDEKIEWLAEEMKKAAGKRIYLFMHFPIPNYAGLKPDYYYGFSETSTEDDRIMNLIRQYDNTYVFSGHTHFNFQCQNDCENITVTPIEGTNSYTIHVPSIAYPRLINTWNMYDQSQGYFVEVYENGIVLKGIDFKQDNKLIPIGCYYLESKPKPYYLSEGATTLYAGQTMNIQILGAAYDNAEWSSSKPEVATVDDFGNVTAKETGVAVITAAIGEYALKVQITVKNAPVETYPTFYIDEKNGSDTNTGLTIGSPFNSLTKATEKANESYGVGDTVEFRFIGTTATYNATVHEYTAVLSSADPEVGTASMQLSELRGDTVFENINVSIAGIVDFDGNNVRFESTVNGEFFNKYLFFKDSSQAVTEEQNIVFEQKLNLAYIVLAADYRSAKWEKAVNLIVDNPLSTKVNICVGNDKAAYTTTYKDNVNVILKDVGGLSTLLIPDTSTFEKDVQIINSSDVDVSATTYPDLAKIDSSKLWILNNQTKGFKDALSVTTTAGKYAVDTDNYTVTATKNGDNTVYTAANGELDLTEGGAGTYTYTVSKQSQSKTYCVGDDQELSNVAQAINAAKNAGDLTAGDTLVLNVTSNIDWGDTATPIHDFNLVITTTLETAPTVTITHKTKLGGNTTFEKIAVSLYNSGYPAPELFLNDYDVIFESDSEIIAWNGILVAGDDTTENSEDGQKLEIKCGISNLTVRLSDRKTPRSYTGDIDIVADNLADDTDAVITFYLEDSNGKATNYQNVNFDIKNAVNPVNIIGSNATFSEGKGLQIINSCGAVIDKKLSSAAEQNIWIINNKTDNVDLITCTGESGKFNVNSDSNVEKVVATDSYSNKIYSDDGYLILDAGEYIIELECVHSFTEYTPDDNAECGKNGTETAACDFGCGEEDTREIEGTALEHEFDGPSDIDCNHGCGYTRPLGKMLVTEGGEKYYYNNGVKQTEVTDLVWIDGVWYYIEEGRWASDIDTLHKINGKWFLVKGGIWNKTTGLEEYKGKTFYVSGGKWNSSVTDLKKVDGVWYYIQYGKWNNTIDTLHKINGKWFLIKKGIWNKTTGLVEYKGKTFYVSGGKWNSSVNTLYKKGSKYYAIKSGKLYEGKTIITYSGKKFYCNKGYAQLSFSGKVKIGSKTYTIKAGKVV